MVLGDLSDRSTSRSNGVDDQSDDGRRILGCYITYGEELRPVSQPFRRLSGPITFLLDLESQHRYAVVQELQGRVRLTDTLEHRKLVIDDR
ncbi:hypothetical protein D3C72_2083660 [compost metagenome]